MFHQWAFHIQLKVVSLTTGSKLEIHSFNLANFPKPYNTYRLGNNGLFRSNHPTFRRWALHIRLLSGSSDQLYSHQQYLWGQQCYSTGQDHTESILSRFSGPSCCCRCQLDTLCHQQNLVEKKKSWKSSILIKLTFVLLKINISFYYLWLELFKNNLNRLILESFYISS